MARAESKKTRFSGYAVGGAVDSDACMPASVCAPCAAPVPMEMAAMEAKSDLGASRSGPAGGPAGGEIQPVIRKEFADTAFWTGSLKADASGEAAVTFKMPENLTGWKIRTWAMGHGTKVGEASAEVVTARNLLLRLPNKKLEVISAGDVTLKG